MRPRIPVRSPLSLAAALLALVGLALACGQDSPAPDAGDAPAEASPPAASEAQPEPSGDAASTRDEIDVVENVVPESYPSDVPIYPEATPGSAMVVPGLGMFITFLTDAETAAVLEHYRTSLGENGWSVSDLPDMGLDAKKEGRSVQVRARPNEEGRTEIALNINEG